MGRETSRRTKEMQVLENDRSDIGPMDTDRQNDERQAGERGLARKITRDWQNSQRQAGYAGKIRDRLNWTGQRQDRRKEREAGYRGQFRGRTDIQKGRRIMSREGQVGGYSG